jgi:hypothetical protein
MHHFQCECAACAEDWCLFEDMPDVLHLVPNFESERMFKKRTGDKKDLVTEINVKRIAVQMCFRAGEVELALIALTELSSMLEQHITKPHQYHIQSNLMASMCIMSKYLKAAIKDARAFDFEKSRFPPTLLNGELVTFEMPKFAGLPDWMTEDDEPKKKEKKKKAKSKVAEEVPTLSDAPTGANGHSTQSEESEKQILPITNDNNVHSNGRTNGKEMQIQTDIISTDMITAETQNGHDRSMKSDGISDDVNDISSEQTWPDKNSVENRSFPEVSIAIDEKHVIVTTSRTRSRTVMNELQRVNDSGSKEEKNLQDQQNVSMTCKVELEGQSSSSVGHDDAVTANQSQQTGEIAKSFEGTNGGRKTMPEKSGNVADILETETKEEISEEGISANAVSVMSKASGVATPITSRSQSSIVIDEPQRLKIAPPTEENNRVNIMQDHQKCEEIFEGKYSSSGGGPDDAVSAKQSQQTGEIAKFFEGTNGGRMTMLEKSGNAAGAGGTPAILETETKEKKSEEGRTDAIEISDLAAAVGVKATAISVEKAGEHSSSNKSQIRENWNSSGSPPGQSDNTEINFKEATGEADCDKVAAAVIPGKAAADDYDDESSHVLGNGEEDKTSSGSAPIVEDIFKKVFCDKIAAAPISSKIKEENANLEIVKEQERQKEDEFAPSVKEMGGQNLEPECAAKKNIAWEKSSDDRRRRRPRPETTSEAGNGEENEGDGCRQSGRQESSRTEGKEETPVKQGLDIQGLSDKGVTPPPSSASVVIAVTASSDPSSSDNAKSSIGNSPSTVPAKIPPPTSRNVLRVPIKGPTPRPRAPPPPPPKMERVALPPTVDQELLLMCEKEAGIAGRRWK